MSAASKLGLALFAALCLACAGCTDLPGRPAPGPEVPRPEQVLDFTTLYGQNCAGCHGENGKDGVAISLANPVYLAVAGQAMVRQVTAHGVTGTLMPPFEKASGGTLSDQQIDSIVQGIFQHWGRANVLGASPAPSYAAAAATVDSIQGPKTFAEFCARCHGANGQGSKAAPGSIVDPSYLALVSDQSLRSTIICGRPDQGMPDWRSDLPGRAMTEQEITGLVAWLAAQRTP